MRVLGVDFGHKRVGLALSDETGTVASPLPYIDGGGLATVSREIMKLCVERQVGKVVVGVPLRLDGTRSEQTERTLAFIAELQAATTIPVAKWDERLTSVQANRALLEGNVRRSHRKEKIDGIAAQLMLQSYLDATSLPQLKSRHFKLTIAYDGTQYAGWQWQPNGKTVQEVVELALAKIDRREVRAYGSGRTDAGVHARGQVANCTLRTQLPLTTLLRALNANLPEDIRVLRLQETDAKFHARFSAKGKEYRYQIDGGKMADPFLRLYAWHHPWPLDVAAMRRAARLLKGRHDFSALSVKPRRPGESNVRTITKLVVTKRGNILTVAVAANGFLYRMVRSIAGALVKVGEGKLAVEELQELVKARKRTALVETAPAHGLFLWRVFY